MIRLSKSCLSQSEKDAVLRVLDGEYLGMGKEVQAFENEISNYIGGDSLVACVNTGTSALHLATQALGIGVGDEVLVPSITYVASLQAISATGAKPVCCDNQTKNCLIDLDDAAKRITSKTKAIMIVHYASNMGDLDEVYSFAKKHNLRVIEDAAHAFGCKYKSKKIGSFGDVICFSFDGIKNITSGEGGAVVTRDKFVYDAVCDARLLGVEKDTEARFQGRRSWDFDVKQQGWRYHMSDVFAAIGRAQLSRFDNELASKRKSLVEKYVQNLKNVEGIELLEIEKSEGTEIIQHIFPIRILNNKKEEVLDALQDNDVQVGFHYKPNHYLTKYKTDYSLQGAELLHKEMITLPLHPDLLELEVEKITETIIKTLG